MFYILHGENELERSEQVADFKRKIGDESVRDLNVTVLDGRKTTLSELQHAADSIPFLADKRLVVVEGLLGRLAGRKPKTSDEAENDSAPTGSAKDFLNSLLSYLPNVSESTRLVFVEAQSIKPTHPILKLAQKQTGKTVIEFPQPQVGELTNWIIKRAKKHGGEIDRAAAHRVAAICAGSIKNLKS
jgi:DNA polymerase-3 subunit delta